MTASEQQHEHEHVHDGTGAHVHPHVHEDLLPGGPGMVLDRVAAGDEADGRGTIALAHVHFRYPDGFEALKGVELGSAAARRSRWWGPTAPARAR